MTHFLPNTRQTRRSWALLGLCAALMTLPIVARADSVFSANGLGEAVHATDVRGRGMGGVALGIDEASNTAPLNPAAMAHIDRFTLHAEAVPELRRATIVSQGVESSSSPRSTNFPNLSVAMGAPAIGAFGVTISQYTDVSYDLNEDGVFNGLPLSRSLAGRNGWSTVGLAWGKTVRPDLSVGARLDFLIGSYLDVWRVDFEDPEAIDTVDSLVVNHSRGPLLRLGALYRPVERLSVGVSLSPARAITLRPEIRNQTGTQRLDETDLDLPLSFGLGAAYRIDRHWLAAGDLVWTQWQDTNLTGSRDNVTPEDVTRVGIGVEYKSNRDRDDADAQLALRAGYYREPWHFRDAAGNRIIEQFGSVGAGIPFPGGTGMLDLSFELGYRGTLDENGARERVARIGVGVTVMETVLIGRVE